MSRITIIGGHGKVALHLARDLTANGHQVTSLFRNPQHTADVEATGATAVVADVENLSTEEIAQKLEGADAVVWSAGAGGGAPERTYAVDRDAAIRSIDAAVAAGARRYVMVSYFGAGPEHGVPEDNGFYAYAEAKAAADEYLRHSGLDWTILGPSALTMDPGTGKIEIGAGIEGTQVSREDVALVAAAVLERPGTIGQTIQFNNGSVAIDTALDSFKEQNA
ncbi:SDR family oxidoreductase [Arthrobacter jiangjiafuii]|uniref:SDR family oxidoreductase n=1 Tax=Arthrobacter jiangjiafuii TaxID=2817475 RepID=A0A975M2Q4_9MICC|nr:SDR family oxidoreductase [Arthrobacter jiangjiafuii]MBP3043276.1 SDR family oxidoreductase [Arthrobacter jiangjiafuii]QWC08820.1 SDR family oxidoreductase [Arthrobacter jiangjiafuii]